MLIQGGDVYAPGGVIRDGAILVEGRHIRAVGSRQELANQLGDHASSTPVVDARDGIIVPGFIDLQVNGAGGRLLSDEPEIKTMRIMADTLPQFGCTSFLPTIVTSSTDRTIQALQAIEGTLTRSPKGARVLGAHVEGPFINPERKGVHERTSIRPPSVEELLRFLHEGSSRIRLLTLAPEMAGADDVILAAVQHGINVSIGHSNATYEQVLHAVHLGAGMATHLFNAMNPLGSREPGTVGAVLAIDALTAGIIADSVHVHPASLTIAARAKGRDGIILVSDAMSPIGTTMTEFRLNGRRITVEHGRCTTEDGTLAGSVLTMDCAVRNMCHLAGVSLDDAIHMATINPARALGLLNSKGSLEQGKDADIVVLSRDLAVTATVVEGTLAYVNRK